MFLFKVISPNFVVVANLVLGVSKKVRSTLAKRHDLGRLLALSSGPQFLPIRTGKWMEALPVPTALTGKHPVWHPFGVLSTHEQLGFPCLIPALSSWTLSLEETKQQQQKRIQHLFSHHDWEFIPQTFFILDHKGISSRVTGSVPCSLASFALCW